MKESRHIGSVMLVFALGFFLLMCTGYTYAQDSRVVQSATAAERTGLFTEFDMSKEIISKRDLTSKHFKNEDGSVSAVVMTAPMHYKDQSEKWQLIDNTITVNSSGSSAEYMYINKTNSFNCYYPAQSNMGFKMGLKEDSYVDWQNPEVGVINNNGDYISLQSNNTVNATVQSNRITYHNIFNDIDAEVMQLNTGRKLNYIVNSPTAFNSVPSNAEYYVISEKISLPQGWSVQTEKIQTPGMRSTDERLTNRVTFYNSNNEIAIQLGIPKIFDSAKKQQRIKGGSTEDDTVRENNYVFAQYSVEQTDNDLILKILIPMSWIKGSNRVYPITIDPTTTAFTTANTTNHTGWSDNSTKTTGEIWFGDNQSQRGWARWALTGVTTDVTDVKLEIFTDNSSFGYSATGFYKMTTDPLTESATNIYTNLYTTLYTSASYDEFTQYSNIDLGATADSDLGGHPSWFGIGIGMTWNDGDWGEIDGHPFNRPILTVTYNPCTPPTAITASTNTATICNGGTGNFQYASHTGGNVSSGSWEYQWETTGTYGGGSVVRAWNATATYSPALTATKTYYLYMRSTACTGSVSPASNGVTVTVRSTFSAGAIAGGGGTICTGGDPDAMTCSGTGGSTTNYRWYWLDGSSCPTTGSFTGQTAWSTTSGYDPPSGLTTQRTYRCYVDDQGSPDCGAATWATNCITVNVDAATVGGDVDDDAICGTTNSGTLTLSGHTGTILKWQYSVSPFSAWNDIANTTTTNGFTNLTETTKYRAQIQNGVCSSTNSTDGTVTFSAPPSAPDAGEDQYVCGTSTTMAAAAGAGTWTVLNGTATITTPSSNTSGVTGLVSGAQATLRWTVGGGSCVAFDDVVLTAQ